MSYLPWRLGYDLDYQIIIISRDKKIRNILLALAAFFLFRAMSNMEICSSRVRNIQRQLVMANASLSYYDIVSHY
jgi:hypothetical protein